MRFFGIDSDRDRRRIQALRADPPGLAGSGARRRVFGAALEQWDALLRASGEIVPTAAPILLFYALSQAGRAACAARIRGQPWTSRGHGLSVGDPSGDLGSTVVRPDGGPSTSFAMFCRATGSATLSEPTTLGALWAANPKLETVPGLGDAATRALDLVLIASGGPTARALIVGPVARGLAADENGAQAELAARLTDYPGATDGLVVSNASPRSSRDGQPQIEIGWRDPSGTPVDVGQIAPGYGMPNSGDSSAPRSTPPAMFSSRCHFGGRRFWRCPASPGTTRKPGMRRSYVTSRRLPCPSRRHSILVVSCFPGCFWACFSGHSRCPRGSQPGRSLPSS
jgi:hypothetical protein